MSTVVRRILWYVHRNQAANANTLIMHLIIIRCYNNSTAAELIQLIQIFQFHVHYNDLMSVDTNQSLYFNLKTQQNRFDRQRSKDTRLKIRYQRKSNKIVKNECTICCWCTAFALDSLLVDNIRP